MQETLSPSPIVSVIVPVYNAANYLRETLDCICNQTLKNIEIILVDDGSTDSTPSILEEYAARDPRIIILRQKNQYAGVARNNGIKHAKGKYFSFLDADDLFEDTMLEKMVSRADEVNADVVICKADSFTESNYSPSSAKKLNRQLHFEHLKNVNDYAFCPANEIPAKLFQFCFVYPWDKLFRAQWVRDIGVRFDSTKQANDVSFVFQCIFRARICSIVKETLAHYRINAESISRNVANKICTIESFKSLETGIEKVGASEEIRNSFLKIFCVFCAGQLYRTDNPNREPYIDELRTVIEPKYNLIDKGESFYDECAAYRLYKRMVAPSISVVVPVYNAQNYLGECLDSLRAQSFQNFEVICINDGSTDSSLKILNDYSKLMPYMRIINVPNGGYGKAMNLGLKAARGKYMAILEPDDYLPKNAYETLIEKAEAHNLDIIRGKFTRFHTNEKGEKIYKEEKDFAAVDRVICPRHFYEYFYNMPLATWTCLFNITFLKDQDIFYHESPGASYQDTGFFMQTFGYAERVMFTNKVVYLYRTDNSASSTNTKSGKPDAIQKEFAFIKERYLTRPERWERLQEHYLLRRMAAHRWMYHSIPGKAIANYLQSFRNELIQLQGIKREKFIAEDHLHFNQLVASPVNFLSNAGYSQDSKDALLELQNPFRKGIEGGLETTENTARPAVSVIVPVYSGMEHFALMVALLRSQTLHNMEFIFVDDCGTDGTFALAELAATDDKRVKLIRNEKNLGPGISRNKGIEAAEGEYIAFVDADDIIPVDYYETLYSTAKKTGALVVKCERANRYADGRVELSPMNQRIHEQISKGEHVVNAYTWEHTTAIYNREHVLLNKARNSNALQDEDTTFLLMTLHNLNTNELVITNDTQYFYRIHEQSITHCKDASFLRESIKSLEDKLNFILAQDSTPALEKYAAIHIEERIRWRYEKAAGYASISDEQRRAYLEQICNLAHKYQEQRASVPIYGVSKKLLDRNMTIDEYMNQMAIHKTENNLSDSPKAVDGRHLIKEDEVHKILDSVNSLPKIVRKYRRYRVLSLITMGKTRRKYKKKYNRTKEIARKTKTILRSFHIQI